jgi:hypothetical protein
VAAKPGPVLILEVEARISIGEMTLRQRFTKRLEPVCQRWIPVTHLAGRSEKRGYRIRPRSCVVRDFFAISIAFAGISG